MSSTHEPASSIPAPRRAGRWRWVVAGAVLMLIALIVWQGPVWLAQARAGSAYAARIGCSCIHVQGRDAASCRADFEPGMTLVRMAHDAEAKTVTGSVPLLASRTARFAGASGCVLDPL